MLRTITALALAIFLPISMAAAESASRKAPAKSARPHAGSKAGARHEAADPNALAAALGTYPAKVDYASNDAPFVVFDVSPRKLDLGADASNPKEVSLIFVATDVLSYVNVFTYSSSGASPSSNDTKEVPLRTACGSKTPGHYVCAVPLRAAVAQLQGGDGWVGMRIETEGLDGDHSTVRVTLPVKAAPPPTAAPKPGAKPAYRHALTFIADEVSRRATHR